MAVLSRLHYHLGMAYVAAENPVGAKQELTQAIDQVQDGFPGNDEARRALARL